MKKDYDLLTSQILEKVGGAENISNAMHCYTRLRINLKDTGLVDIEKLKKLNVIGVQFSGEQLQIIIGNEINEVYNSFIKLSGIKKEEVIPERLDKKLPKKKHTIRSVVSSVIDGIVGCMIPILPMLIASGILKAIVLTCIQLGLATEKTNTMVVLSFVADSAFYFMPVIVGGFAAKKFGANVSLGAMLGAALIHPTFMSLVADGTALNIFGLPIYSANYTNSVIPIILSVWIMSYVEKFISKHSPKSLRVLIEPVLTIIIMIPLSFSILAPIGAMLSVGFANILTWFYGTFGAVAVTVFCAIIPWIVMFGMHIGTVPISISSLTATGIDKIVLPAFLISNFTQGAACLAVGIKTKETNLKSLAFSSAFSDIIPGVSEPGMYGVTLRYKTPMWGAMTGAAAGGFYFGLTGVGAFSYLPPNVFSLAGYIGSGEFSNNLMNTIIGILIGMVVAFFVTMILYKPEIREGGK